MHRLLLKILFFTLGFLSAFLTSWAQELESPDQENLFEEDRDEDSRIKQRKDAIRSKKKARAPVEGAELPFDISAPSIEFDSEGNKVRADGGLVITYGSTVVEAQSGDVDVQTNEVEISGDVRISDPSAVITADTAKLNLDSGTGQMSQTEIYFAENEFRLFAEDADKVGEEEYTLKRASLTTCECPEGDDCIPWSIYAKDAEITQNGYGQIWNGFLTVHDVPVFYVPYLFFPVKTERQTGVLTPVFGTGRRSGFEARVPFFWAIDNSTDMTITPHIETKVRYGFDSEFRKVFSRQNSLTAGLTYFNESRRDGDLLGTNVSDLDDPELDENRFAGYYDQNWQFDLGTQPFQLLVDGRYTSDDLFVREFDKPEIAKENARFITSTAVLRTGLFETYALDLSTEYNQALVDDDDFVLQRLPTLNISGFQTFRAFGENPYGLKLILSSTLEATNFSRSKSFDGLRSELYERVRMPFHYRNIFEGEFEVSARGTLYNLNEDARESKTEDESGNETTVFEERLDDSTSRVVPEFRAKIGTVVEKVFEVPENSWLKRIGELGRIARKEKLVRMKHTIEPNIAYRYVPDVDQSDNPQFDSKDRLAQRSLVTYGITQRLFARYEPRDRYAYGIEETTPEISDLGSLRQNTPIDQEMSFGFDRPFTDQFSALRRGSVREVATFKVSQSYDIVEERDDLDPGREPLSDLDVSLALFPNEYVRLKAETDFDIEESEFRAYTLAAQLLDKRGDQIRTRLRYVEDQVRQLESGVEIKLTERLKVGYYSRYDDLNSEFIETRVGLRIASQCRCWLFDLDVVDEINPDETKVSFNVTLVGLGELGNTFFSNLSNNQGSS